jgi:hypothetical protein
LDLDGDAGGSVGAARLGFDDNRFFSDRVDPRSLRYHRVYADWSIPDLALK